MSLDEWFDKEMDSLDNELADGVITPERHRQLSAQLRREYRDAARDEDSVDGDR